MAHTMDKALDKLEAQENLGLFCTPGRTRTRTLQILSLLPLPLGYGGIPPFYEKNSVRARLPLPRNKCTLQNLSHTHPPAAAHKPKLHNFTGHNVKQVMVTLWTFAKLDISNKKERDTICPKPQTFSPAIHARSTTKHSLEWS